MSRSSHARGRRRPIPRIRGDGRWYGMGPEALDVESGWLFPRDWMVPQQGGPVSRQRKDNSYDEVYSRLDRGGAQRSAVPLIQVTASVPTATESGTSGIFTFLRRGDESTAFDVEVGITGTAINGFHYQTILPILSFAAGEVSRQVLVVPIAGRLAGALSATVVLTAVPTGDSDYYAAFTAVPVGPLSGTNYITNLTNYGTVTIVP